MKPRDDLYEHANTQGLRDRTQQRVNAPAAFALYMQQQHPILWKHYRRAYIAHASRLLIPEVVDESNAERPQNVVPAEG